MARYEYNNATQRNLIRSKVQYELQTKSSREVTAMTSQRKNLALHDALQRKSFLLFGDDVTSEGRDRGWKIGKDIKPVNLHTQQGGNE